MDKRTYWDERFATEHRIWGDTPSTSAYHALTLFKRYPIEKILVLGVGYGRNAQVFSNAGYHVVGLDISKVALDLGAKFDPKTTFHDLSVFHLEQLEETFDAIYAFNLLHLFLKVERETIINQCLHVLNPKGLLFFVVFSEHETNFGVGKQIEPNTFETRPNRPAHYYTEADLLRQFHGTTILESGFFEEQEIHGEGPHTHKLRYILCLK